MREQRGGINAGDTHQAFAGLPKRQIPSLPLPFGFVATGTQQMGLLDGQPQRGFPADLENCRHGLALANTLVRERGKCAQIVREQDPAIPDAPMQDCRVVATGQTDVLDARDIRVTSPAT